MSEFAYGVLFGALLALAAASVGVVGFTWFMHKAFLLLQEDNPRKVIEALAAAEAERQAAE